MSQIDALCPNGADQTFGPWAGTDCRHGFDFTLLFEESILSITVSSIFLIAVPFCVWVLVGADKKVVSSWQQWPKFILSLFFVGINTALLVLFAKTPSVRTIATIPTAALQVAASLAVVIVSYLEHERALRPSLLLTVFLFLSVLLDLARTRTLWLLNLGSVAIPAVLSASMGLRVVMIVVESLPKRNIVVEQYRHVPLEMTSNTFSRGVFWWLWSLFFTGYKRLLTLNDLYPLPDKLKTRRLYAMMRAKWEKVHDKAAPGALLTAWARVFWVAMCAPVIPKLFQSAFVYAQPFLIKAAINLATQPVEPFYQNVGYGLIGAYTIVFAGEALATGQYEWHVYRAATTMKGSLASLIYHKALRLDITSEDVSPDGALTLVSTDCETIVHGILYVHELWGGIVEICLGIYLIYRELGAACAIPISVVFVSMIATVFLAIPTGTAQADWIQASQERVTATSKSLGSIKWLRVSGLNESVFDMLRSLREHELKVSERCRKLLAASVVLVICVPIWSPILTFITFASLAASGNTTLTISKAFTAYSVFILVNKPLSDIIVAMPVIATSITSFHRIQKYMNGKERVDKRVQVQDTSRQDSRGSDEKDPDRNAEKNTQIEKSSEKSEKPELATSTTEKRDGDDIIASIQGTYTWPKSEKPVINIADPWKIQRGAFTLVLGPVGCGKSTLLSSLLGELSRFDGSIQTSYSGVSYCAQSPWLPNETIRKVITGASDFDETFYRQVISACALNPDIESWPKGEDTNAGTKGITVSGGQKQRLSIARAIYSRKEFLILDDTLSGLDSMTEDKIFHALLGADGLLRTGRMTILVASSDVRRAPYADYVLVLDKDGKVVSQGKPSELDLPKTVRETGGDFDSSTDASKSRFDEPLMATAVAQVAQLESGAAVMYEDSERRLGDSATYMFYIRAAGWVSVVIFLISMVVFAFGSSFPNIWLKWWSESNQTRPNQDLGKWLGVYAALGLGATAAILIGAQTVFMKIMTSSGIYFHEALLKTTAQAPMSFHAKVDSGITVNRFSQDIQLIDMELPGAGMGVAVGVAFCVADFIMISISSRYMAVFIPVLVLVLYCIQHFYLRTSRQMRLLDIEHKAPLYTQLIKSLDGLVTIRAFQWEGHMEDTNMDLVDRSQQPSYLLYCLQRWLTFSIDSVITLLAFALIVMTTTLRETIGPAYVGIALSNILGLSAAVKSTLTSWVQLEVALGAVSRVRKFAINTPPEDDPAANLKGPDNASWPGTGTVEFRGLSASYDVSKSVLRNIDLRIEPGHKVAICGRTGGGKSSLVMCLLRMMEPDSGAVLVDGVDIASLPHDLVRRKLVGVPQETFVFPETVKLNLDPSATASEEDVRAVLEKVQLWDKIESRGGLETVIHDRMFSQGELQLLVLARAMLRKGTVLILDEFTSSLDTDTSTIVYDVLRTWFTDWTVISIVHKMDSISYYDKVAVIDAGHLIEYDATGKLLLRDSAFRKLYEATLRHQRFKGDVKAGPSQGSSVVELEE